MAEVDKKEDVDLLLVYREEKNSNTHAINKGPAHDVFATMENIKVEVCYSIL
jgi:hypothetical protein